MNTKTVPVTFVSVKDLWKRGEELYGYDMMDDMSCFGEEEKNKVLAITEDSKPWDPSSLDELFPSISQILAHLRDLGELQNGLFMAVYHAKYENIGV